MKTGLELFFKVAELRTKQADKTLHFFGGKIITIYLCVIITLSLGDEEREF